MDSGNRISAMAAMAVSVFNSLWRIVEIHLASIVGIQGDLYVAPT